MKKIIAKKKFRLYNTIYNIGDEIDVEDKDMLCKLNENGYIEPLTNKELKNC